MQSEVSSLETGAPCSVLDSGVVYVGSLSGLWCLCVLVLLSADSFVVYVGSLSGLWCLCVLVLLSVDSFVVYVGSSGLR